MDLYHAARGDNFLPLSSKVRDETDNGIFARKEDPFL